MIDGGCGSNSVTMFGIVESPTVGLSFGGDISHVSRSKPVQSMILPCQDRQGTSSKVW